AAGILTTLPTPLTYLAAALGVHSKTQRVRVIDRVAGAVHQCILSPGKPHRIARRPPSSSRLVVPRPKPHEPSVRIDKPSGKPKGLQPGIRVKEHATKLIMLEPLHHVAGCRVNGGLHGADLIHDEPQALGDCA